MPRRKKDGEPAFENVQPAGDVQPAADDSTPPVDTDRALAAAPTAGPVTATLAVLRFDPHADCEAHWQRYDVTLPEGSTVLEALMHVQDHQDGSLAFRRSCRHAICGSCGMRINGCARLACNTQLAVVAEEARRKAEQAGVAAPAPGTTADASPVVATRAAPGVVSAAPANPLAPAAVRVEPLGNMPVIKDLITDMADFWEKLRRVQPWLQNLDEHPDPDHERLMSPAGYSVISQALLCVECGCCYSDCCSLEASADFVGPTALAKAFRYAYDSRDDQAHRRMFDLSDEHGIWECTRCYFCTQRCPKHLRVRELITQLGGLAYEEGLRTDAGVKRAAAVRTSVIAGGRLDQARMTLEAGGPLQALSRVPAAAHAALTGKLTVKPPEPIEDVDDLHKVICVVEESRIESGQPRTEGRP
jgi:succinate dehydrogenase / fumarate reductase, iron-sulfur subunit